MASTVTMRRWLLLFLAVCGIPSQGATGGLSASADAPRPPASTQPSTRHSLDPSAASYPSLQQALDTNRGKPVYLPPGDYEINEKLRIRGDGSGLCGPGRIIQTNPNAPILEIENAANVRIRDLTLCRPTGKQETHAEALLAIRCRDLLIADVQVLENRTRSSAIALRDCAGAQIRGCLVRNYMRITVDDRTKSPDWGYAFKCIDGTGINVEGQAVLVQNNRVIEHDLLPTPKIKEQHDLGRFVKRNPQKGALTSQKLWDEQHVVNNWHQGSAITINAPKTTHCIQVLGNYIENAAQGLDIHADNVIIAQNIVNNAHAGMKAMHGSRHVLILGNQFLKNSLWSIGLMPGAASHAPLEAGPDGKPAPANVDGGSIIANNIISDFGYGNASWIWGHNNSPLKFDSGQKPHNPPLTDVLVQGNIIYNTGRDGILVDGKPQVEPPRYRYAVILTSQARNIRFANNLFHPGTDGLANTELKP